MESPLCLNAIPLSLKYRPNTLDEVIGQPIVTQAFSNAFKYNTLHYAYILNGKFGCGKCVVGDTMVLTDRGLQYIKDIVPAKKGISSIDCHVIDEQGEGYSKFGYYEDKADTIKLINNLGIKIEGTEEHPLRVFNTETCEVQWKKMADIQKSDYLPIRRQFVKKNKCNNLILDKAVNFEEKYVKNISLPIYANSDFARFIGYLISEGNVSNNSIKFINSNNEILTDYENLVLNLFGIKVSKVKDKKKDNLYNYDVSSAILIEFLNEIGGINVDSKEKHIPKNIFNWEQKYINEFLKALFEGNGNINGLRISYTSTSYRLCFEIQQLLLTMGIVSYLKTDNISYSVNIAGVDAKIFYDKINFVSECKKNKLLQLIIKNETNCDIIPGIAKYAYNVLQECVEITKSGKMRVNDSLYLAPKKPENFVSIAKKNKNITYNKLSEIIDYLYNILRILSSANGSKICFDKLKQVIEKCELICEQNYFYSNIIEISKGNAEVYDICKDGCDKSFVANGYISHNTTIARIVAAMENCEKGPTQQPCGVCKNCKEIFSGKSFDVREIDAASNRGIEDMRNLKKDIYLAPLECRTKYVIIDEAHSLTKEGAESALKMIEEPPPKVRFIFATTDLHKMKDTIKSRCLKWRVNQVSWLDIYNHLKSVASKEGIEIEDEALKICAKSSDNSVRNSLQNLQTAMNYVGKERITAKAVIEALGVVDKKIYFDLINAIAMEDAAKALYCINYLLMDGTEIGIILNDLSIHLSHLIKARILKKDLSGFAFSEEEAKRYCEQSDVIKSGNVLLAMMECLRQISFGVNYNLNPQAQLESFAITSITYVRNAKIKVK